MRKRIEHFPEFSVETLPATSCSPSFMNGVDRDVASYVSRSEVCSHVSKKAGVDDSRKLHGMGVIWGDYDGDGWPDLILISRSQTSF